MCFGSNLWKTHFFFPSLLMVNCTSKKIDPPLVISTDSNDNFLDHFFRVNFWIDLSIYFMYPIYRSQFLKYFDRRRLRYYLRISVAARSWVTANWQLSDAHKEREDRSDRKIGKVSKLLCILDRVALKLIYRYTFFLLEIFKYFSL